MNSNDLWMYPFSIVIPFIAFFLSGVIIKRHEECISDFYWALREKHPRSYVKQNKIIKLIRKCLGLEIKGTIYWAICIFHYLQIIMIISPIFIILLYLFIELEDALCYSWVIGGAPFGITAITDEVFLIIQVQRCSKIKKIDSKYSKCNFYDWRG